MSYRITTPVMSEHDGEQFGAWLKRYAITVTGLEVWQIGASGKRYRDNATAQTIRETVGEVGAAVALAPVAIPLIGLFPPLAAILAALNAISIPSLVGLKKAQHSLNKRIPGAGVSERIDHTELEFDFANVSPERQAWAEYLIARYGATRGWSGYEGFEYAAQIDAGARAARDPIPWADRPRGRPAPVPPRGAVRTSERQAQPAGLIRRTWRDLL